MNKSVPTGFYGTDNSGLSHMKLFHAAQKLDHPSAASFTMHTLWSECTLGRKMLFAKVFFDIVGSEKQDPLAKNPLQSTLLRRDFSVDKKHFAKGPLQRRKHHNI
uniref:Uncharacterized protein n=1 Tax=Romanomermis culicivorax TaxID=13658 RepID=A0A915HWY2_ROMCU